MPKIFASETEAANFTQRIMLLGMSSSLISDLVRESPQTQSQELFSLAKQTDVSSWLKTVRMRWWNTKASSQCTCNPAPNKASPTDHSEAFTVIFAGRDPCGDQFESLSSSPVYFPNALFSASVHFFFSLNMATFTLLSRLPTLIHRLRCVSLALGTILFRRIATSCRMFVQ